MWANHLHSACAELLLGFTERGALFLQTYSPQWLCVLFLSNADNVLDFLCQVSSAALHHRSHKLWHRPRACSLLSSSPAKQHVQHQVMEIIPVETRILAWIKKHVINYQQFLQYLVEIVKLSMISTHKFYTVDTKDKCLYKRESHSYFCPNNKNKSTRSAKK